MTTVNKAGADWLALRSYIKTEISRLRDELEHPGPLSGDLQRGGIAALRKLIAEVEPDFVPTDEGDVYTSDPN